MKRRLTVKIVPNRGKYRHLGIIFYGYKADINSQVIKLQYLHVKRPISYRELLLTSFTIFTRNCCFHVRRKSEFTSVNSRNIPISIFHDENIPKMSRKI